MCKKIFKTQRYFNFNNVLYLLILVIKLARYKQYSKRDISSI